MVGLTDDEGVIELPVGSETDLSIPVPGGAASAPAAFFGPPETTAADVPVLLMEFVFEVF